ncbi:hypothetical protein [Actinoplanes derwentensis]|uniref:Uncharacterized protein n=1 Tax=Actinoplanes derwentensis TaxID=113562 RepID=A0A1H1VG79_9ACTN|nr:hypothetical protein [Actinoplanes derwentensis]GID83703.1 hypothetical protein Ade03nite_26270 [Actinoplanes derwentensis]SDS83857.1 hypothetical protein SAMN04489716_1753 [Actinoplanes derwentensis]
MIALVLAGAMLAAAPANAFSLSTAGASAYGSYDRMMSIPERPVPPIAVSGTLAVNRPGQCAVVQIAYNGPADGIAWRTLSGLCRPGKTNFRATSQLLWGGAEPPLRLCAGPTTRIAEQGRNCDVYRP